MAANVDVSGRLDEGQAAVDTIAEYVWACHVLGFLHPDLTGYRYQVQDWYAAEDGLDLRVLETECTALAITANAADQALQLQGNNFRELSRAWQGAGAQASTDFLTRHATSSAQVVAGIGSAAGTLTRLRERLWSAVDAKVATAVQIEARRAGQRGTWLAAARTVSSGVGDLSAASELIDTQVKPFVANDIGGDFLTAMRGAAHAVTDAYAEAISALRAEVLPTFGVPGELGPAWAGPVAPPGVGALAAVSTPGLSAGSSSTPPWAAAPPVVPAAMPAVMPAAMPAGSPGAASPPWPAPGPEPIATMAGPNEAGPYEAGAAAPASPAGLGSGLGGGLPGVGGLSDIGSGLAGTGQQLADLFGGLFGSSAGGLGDDLGDLRADGIEDLGPDADLDTGEDVSDDDSDGETEDDSGEHVDQNGSEDGENAEETADIDPAGADDGMETADAQQIPAEPYAQESTPVGPPPPVPVNEPAAEPLAAPDGGTPCAIAADELPQAGP